MNSKYTTFSWPFEYNLRVRGHHFDVDVPKGKLPSSRSSQTAVSAENGQYPFSVSQHDAIYAPTPAGKPFFG
jgi:hypothetical protein